MSGFARLRFLEKVLVYAPEFDCSACPDTDAALDHQVCQTTTIEKDNTLRKVLHEVPRLSAEGRRGDKDTLACAEPDQTAHEGLHVRPTNSIRGRVSFGLDVNAIEP